MSKVRRHFSAQFKLETVLEAIKGEKPIAQICRERNIKDSLYYKWREQFERQAGAIFGETRPDQQVHEQAQRIAELERLVGQLSLENAALKKAQVLRPTALRRSA